MILTTHCTHVGASSAWPLFEIIGGELGVAKVYHVYHVHSLMMIHDKPPYLMERN